MIIFWLIVCIVLVAAELATTAMVSIWFAAGSACAMACAFLGGGQVLQIVVFLVVSVLTLAVFKIKGEKATSSTVPTNADRVIGREARVMTAIDNHQEEGLVTVDGQDWTARAAEDGDIIGKGELVRVLRIEGVKLIVERI